MNIAGQHGGTIRFYCNLTQLRTVGLKGLLVLQVKYVHSSMAKIEMTLGLGLKLMSHEKKTLAVVSTLCILLLILFRFILVSSKVIS